MEPIYVTYDILHGICGICYSKILSLSIIEYFKIRDCPVHERRSLRLTDIIKKCIQNQNLIDKITADYQTFCASGKSLEDFFGRQIVHGSQTEKLKRIFIAHEEISKQPLFLIKNRNHKLIYGWNFNELRARKPIKMALEHICAMHGKPYAIFKFDEIPEYIHVVSVSNGKAFIDQNMPGEPITAEKILVGHEDGTWFWIPNEEIIDKLYRCRVLPGRCLYSTTEHTNFLSHESTCTDKTTVKSKQIKLGDDFDSKTINLLVKAGVLPDSFIDYRQPFFATWDLETLENEPESYVDGQEALLRLVSIGLATNIPNKSDQFFVRDSSEPTHGQQMVDKFLDALFELELEFQKSLPVEFHNARQRLKYVQLKKFSQLRTTEQFLRRMLDNLLTFNTYAFNGGKFDMKILAPYIYAYAHHRGIEISAIKRCGSYFSLTLERKLGNRIQKICFRDVLNFTSPTTLEKYMSQWGARATKSIFPYSHYKSIEELKQATDFPDQAAFFNELKQQVIDPESYEMARSEFNRRKSLPPCDPQHMSNMADWLKYYNMLDVQPLVEAIDNSFKTFHGLFKIDPQTHHSLPSMAFQAMFQSVPKELPFGFTFDNQRDFLRQWFRNTLIGGLSSVYHRHLDLSGETTSPTAARHTPDGALLTHAVFLDFNSMYLWSQSKNMPLTPGILWTANGSFFRKSIMAPGVSFGQVQWLMYLQVTQCYDSNHQKVQISHAYFRGEVNFDGHKPDGFAVIDGVKHFYEYLGCRYHPDCCVSDDKIDDPENKRKVWNKKKAYFESEGTLHVMRECQWKRFLKSRDLPISTPISRILHRDTQQSLLDAITDDQVFGFVKCDIHTPVEIIEADIAQGFLFPPVIQRVSLEEQHLSPYMLERYTEDQRSPAETVVQTYNGTQLLVFTPVIQHYIKRGMKISNITQFVQYQPGQIFKPFTEKVTEGRIAATYARDEAKANTFKLFGNSGNNLKFW